MSVCVWGLTQLFFSCSVENSASYNLFFSFLQEIELVEKTTFAEIIRMNTGIDECPDHVFFASRNCDGARNHQCVPKSGDMNYEYEYERVRKEKDEEMKKTLTLTIVAGVLGFVALLCLIVALALTLCGRRNIQKASEPRNGKATFFSVFFFSSQI